MPTLSTFYGILIQMFWNDHQAPHFHTRYREHTALIRDRDLGGERLNFKLARDCGPP